MSLRHRIEYFSQDLLLALSKMSVFGLFPALFQLSSQQDSWQSNDSMIKSSSANTASRSTTKEAHEVVKAQVNLISTGSSKMTSDDQKRTADQERENVPLKKSKKKKKKKGKQYRMSSINDADQESTADMPSLPRVRSCSRESCCITGVTEFGHQKTDAKSTSTGSQSTLNSVESRQLSNSYDFGGSLNSSDASVSQDLDCSRNKVEKTGKAELATKQGKNTRAVSSSATVRSATELDFVNENLKDARGRESKLSGKVSHREHMLPRYGNCRSNETSGTDSNQNNYGAERRKTSRGKVIVDGDNCSTKWISKNIHTSVDLDSHVFRNDHNTKDQCEKNSKMWGASTVASSQFVKYDNKGYSRSFPDSSRVPNHVAKHKQIGKENTNVVWQRTGRYIESTENYQRHSSNIDQRHMMNCLQDPITQHRHNSVVDDEVLPVAPLLHAPEHGLQQPDENVGSSDPVTHRTKGSVVIESPECIVQQRWSAKPDQYVPKHVLGNMDYTSSKYKPKVFKSDNVYNRRESWISKADLSMTQSRSNIHIEALEVPKAGHHRINNIDGRKSSLGGHHYSSDSSRNHVTECLPLLSVSLLDFERQTEELGRHKHLSEIQPHSRVDIPVADDIARHHRNNIGGRKSSGKTHLYSSDSSGNRASECLPLSDFELSEPWTEESGCHKHLSEIQPHARADIRLADDIEGHRYRNNIGGRKSSHGYHHGSYNSSGNRASECLTSCTLPSSDFELGEPWTKESGSRKHLSEIQPRASADNLVADDIARHHRNNIDGQKSRHGNYLYRTDSSGKCVSESALCYSVPLSDFELGEPWTEESGNRKHLPEVRPPVREGIPVVDDIARHHKNNIDGQKSSHGNYLYRSNCSGKCVSKTAPYYSVPLSDFELGEPWTEESGRRKYLSDDIASQSRNNIDGRKSEYGNHHCSSNSSGNHVSEYVPLSDFELGEPWTEESGRRKHMSEIQPPVMVDIPVVCDRVSDDIASKASHLLLVEENNSSTCFANELPREKLTLECIMPMASVQKHEFPVDKKDSPVLKTENGMDQAHQERGSVVCEGASIMNICGMEKFNGPNDSIMVNCLGEGKSSYSAYIASDIAVGALEAAYSLQVASERFLLATGRHIAEFEKFLYRASPVIIPSLLQKYCEAITKYQPTQNSVNNFQNLEVTLRDVWSWYEKPGNYGLEVMAECSHNKEGTETETESFSAHFVPYLSAIQLFSSSSIPRTETVVENKVSCTIAVEKQTRECSLVSPDGNGYSNSVSALCSSNDSKVIFEYFEHEPPQQRKPFYAKVKDLMDGSTSSQVFGDPSMLECIKLQDLHPASWYSVAWYPIYRIPEGSFRASFLTYHSLGHLVMRNVTMNSKEGNAFCAVSPVLGMQSYNAQVENWFEQKKPTESHIKDSMLGDSSELLTKRLRALEENAALFARGYVRKGHIDVQNRHPDYEFYLTRRR